MKTKTFGSLMTAAVFAAGLQFGASNLNAAEAAKTYQVTGPVLELTDKSIVVQKGQERWEAARDEKTKVTGDLKVGAKVTIQYRMVATSVEVKGEKAEGKSKAK